ncbi:alpha/beta hydrolase [Sporichthya polymorpha]|uniref:alpha/beta hydrolase n=1 Tax=Sporichthya polymorpha TaxID=35751 RepID=UPI000369F55B|nr:alpha/beta hydrolase [Sporichthya polymorpha]
MRVRTLLSSTLAAVVIGALFTAPASAAPDNDVVQMPVSFKVTNTNTSALPCSSDGKNYTVNGVVVGPRNAIAAGRAATLYLHAVTWGAYYFNLNIPGHNYAHEMAKRGHVSVLVDRLGYGSSGKPAGFGTCFGSEADVAHQMVDQLRSGAYTLKGAKKTPAYHKVFISGSSVGGLISNVVAYSYGNVDGVFNQSWGDFTAGPYTGAESASIVARCSAGGDAGAPPYYAQFAKDSRDTFYFNDASPDVRAAVPPSQPDPCGQFESVAAGIGADLAHLGEIDVPVLVMFGTGEVVFPQPPSADQMAARYSGSPKVTKLIIDGASHYPIVEQGFPQMVEGADRWLNENGG